MLVENWQSSCCSLQSHRGHYTAVFTDWKVHPMKNKRNYLCVKLVDWPRMETVNWSEGNLSCRKLKTTSWIWWSCVCHHVRANAANMVTAHREYVWYKWQRREKDKTVLNGWNHGYHSEGLEGLFPRLNPFHSHALIRSDEQPTKVIGEEITFLFLIPKRFSCTSAV